MSSRLRAGRRATITLILLALVYLGGSAFAPGPGAASPHLMVLIGGVRDACTGNPIVGATLTVTPLGMATIPPGSPVRVVTSRGGWYAAILTAGPYTASVSAAGYTPLGGPNGDQDSVFTAGTNPVHYRDFVLHPPSPC